MYIIIFTYIYICRALVTPGGSAGLEARRRKNGDNINVYNYIYIYMSGLGHTGRVSRVGRPEEKEWR